VLKNTIIYICKQTLNNNITRLPVTLVAVLQLDLSFAHYPAVCRIIQEFHYDEIYMLKINTRIPIIIIIHINKNMQVSFSKSKSLNSIPTLHYTDISARKLDTRRTSIITLSANSLYGRDKVKYL